MFDPVGTREKHGLTHATSEAWDMFQELLTMKMIVVHVNGDEMAWVIECLLMANGETLRTYSIETFAWDADGNLTIKTFYDMPESVGVEDDPHEHLLGVNKVIPNEPLYRSNCPARRRGLGPGLRHLGCSWNMLGSHPTGATGATGATGERGRLAITVAFQVEAQVAFTNRCSALNPRAARERPTAWQVYDGAPVNIQ